jgi:dTDP-glucose pyrophosphorylase
MARSGASVPKPLVEVAGVPLLERNLVQLAGGGFERVVVAVNERAGTVRRFVADRLVPLARVLGVEVEELVEARPLGNIGAAGILRGRVEELLVVYADNLTTLDLPALVAEHRTWGPALTLAAHHEPFTMPYGELVVDDGRLVRYTEKPTLQVLVASAVVVIGPAGLAALPQDRPTGISDLAQGLVDAGEEVRVTVHDAAWVDVNDLASVTRAETIVGGAPEMETWLASADEDWALDIDLDGGAVDTSDVLGAPHRWRRARVEAPAGGAGDRGAAPLGTFDVVDVTGNRTVRVVATATPLPAGEPVGPLDPGRPGEPDLTWVAARLANRLAHSRPALRPDGAAAEGTAVGAGAAR